VRRSLGGEDVDDCRNNTRQESITEASVFLKSRRLNWGLIDIGINHPQFDSGEGRAKQL
jgi:hypothetical protein